MDGVFEPQLAIIPQYVSKHTLDTSFLREETVIEAWGLGEFFYSSDSCLHRSTSIYLKTEGFTSLHLSSNWFYKDGNYF